MNAYGYIRKSVVHDPARMLSPETQEAAIRALAARHGDDDVVILSDLDISGKKDRTKRRGWNELLRAVEEGETSAIYAYSLSRFARSVSELAEFFELCDLHRVPVRIDRDHIDTSTATGKLVGNVLASLAQFESDVASERVRDAFATKRVNDPTWRGPGAREYGSLEGEDASLVIAAFREAGSYDGAARALNAGGVQNRLKRGIWYGTTVRDIVRRLAPDEVAPGTSRGAKAGTYHFRFSRLIACSTCGTFLTGSFDARRKDVRYYCRRARVTPHARGWVNESKLLPVVAAEAERAALMVRRLQKGNPEDETRIAALAAKRARVIDTYADGLIDKPERDRRIAEVSDLESKLSTRRWVRRITIPLDVERDDPARVNAYVRRLFTRVTVDMSEPALRGPSRWVPTLAFEWRDSSLRAEVSEGQIAPVRV
jgi:DNA invertase Pin-like site-specific DNA recombinase